LRVQEPLSKTVPPRLDQVPLQSGRAENSGNSAPWVSPALMRKVSPRNTLETDFTVIVKILFMPTPGVKLNSRSIIFIYIIAIYSILQQFCRPIKEIQFHNKAALMVKRI